MRILCRLSLLLLYTNFMLFSSLRNNVIRITPLWSGGFTRFAASTARSTSAEGDSTSFRNDFQGTRVFVSNIPPSVNWQVLKDHFRVKLGLNVVYASISKDMSSGMSKGCGIVQFETKGDVIKCIELSKSIPLEENILYVREDHQEKRGEGKKFLSEKIYNRKPGSAGDEMRPKRWSLAEGYTNEGLAQLGVDVSAVEALLEKREIQRARKNFKASDDMRNELRVKFGVQVEDKLHQWKPLMKRTDPVAGGGDLDDFFNKL